ncbi:MAG TPA: hypothetical protein VNL70_06575 [Tepidisphaeraceae bacterium]|nr:hypothetical protein [Tepidisphaeraceae bacterium]
MYFASPLWLLGLIAWAAVAVWVLTGKRQQRAVPFVNLWRGPVTGPRTRAAMHVPPLAVILLLLAALAAILAAGQPHLRSGDASARLAVSIIVDRGLSMSALGQTRPRWQELLIAAREPILQHLGLGPVRLVLVPGTAPVETDRSRWTDAAMAEQSPTRDTRDLLPQTVRNELHRAAGAVVVLSDQPLDLNDDRLVQIAPETAASNVGIVMVSARPMPPSPPGRLSAVQIMVRVRNDSSFSQAALRAFGEDISVSQPIPLPPTGQEANYFIDMPDAPGTIELALETPLPDSLAVDNRATLQRTQSWPMIEVGGELPAEVLRMLRVYGRIRPSSEGSARVTVSTEDVAGPAVIVAGAGGSLGPWPEVRVEDHPVAREVDWRQALSGASLARLPDEAGWHAVVMAAERPVVAVQEAPWRRVWVGMMSDRWPRSTDFVVFWTNALDWVGQGQELYRAEYVQAVPMPPAIQTNWQDRLKRLGQASASAIELSRGLVMAAMLLMGLGIWAWQKRGAMGSAELVS